MPTVVLLNGDAITGRRWSAAGNGEENEDLCSELDRYIEPKSFDAADGDEEFGP